MQEPQKQGPSGRLVDSVRGADTPATITLCASAIMLSIGGWTHPGLEPFVLDARAFSSEPWRLLSMHFVHVNVIHLYCNLTGMWYLGREIERRLGAPLLIGICLCIMLGTSAVVQAFDRGGIGLSGLLYGLWAMILVGQRRCERLRGILSARANWLMVGWFFLCIVATVTGTLPISNWGHGGGAVLGALVGLAFGEDARIRRASLPLGAALLALLTAGATVWWPAWNFGGAALEFQRRGDDALERKDWSAAEVALRTASKLDASDGRSWWNLSCALQRLGNEKESGEAGYRSFECGDLDQERVAVLKNQVAWLRSRSDLEGDSRSAFVCAQRLSAIAPDDVSVWRDLERRAQELGDESWRKRAQAALDRLGENR